MKKFVQKVVHDTPMLKRDPTGRKAKYLQPFYFCKEFLRESIWLRDAIDPLDEQAAVEAFGRFHYGEDFLLAKKDPEFVPNDLYDVRYVIVFWKEVP